MQVSILIGAVVVLVLGVASPDASARRNTVGFDEHDLFFELNDTDGDLGIHAVIDGGPWKRLTIKSPERRKEVLDIKAKRRLRHQGLTELRFESAEPTFDELDPEDFFARFPEGPYEIKGMGLDGETLLSTATISHVMPAPPEFIAPAQADCDDPLVVTAPVTISWEEVDASHPDLGEEGDIEVARYELAVEQLDGDLTFFVELPPEVTSFPVPALFTDEPGAIKFEVLVKAENGNRTASESCFEIE